MRKILNDISDEFTVTFPEYSSLWAKWTTSHMLNMSQEEIDVEIDNVFQYCLEYYPKHFFDILYKSEEFLEKATEPVYCLPGVDFRVLFQLEGVTEKTKVAIWNYLQLILFQIIGSVKDKDVFGKAGGMFADINDEDLLKKLTEAIKNMTDVFEADNPAAASAASDDADGSNTTNSTNIPNPEDLHSHLKGIFDGKIGSIAKEMAEEIAHDLEGLLGDDFKDVKSTQDVLKRLMKDPSRLTAIIKTVGDKLNAKMQSGEVNQEELLQEAQNIFGKMKGFDGLMNDKRLKELMKMFAKMATGGAGSDFDMEELFKSMGEKMNKQQVIFQGQGVRTGSNTASTTFKDKLKQRMMKKKEAQAAALLEAQRRMEEAQKQYVPFDFEDAPKPTKQQNTKTPGTIKNNVFTVEGEEAQLKSDITPPTKNKTNKQSKNKKNKN
jgi:hypothetical protein